MDASPLLANSCSGFWAPMQLLVCTWDQTANILDYMNWSFHSFCYRVMCNQHDSVGGMTPTVIIYLNTLLWSSSSWFSLSTYFPSRRINCCKTEAFSSRSGHSKLNASSGIPDWTDLFPTLALGSIRPSNNITTITSHVCQIYLRKLTVNWNTDSNVMHSAI